MLYVHVYIYIVWKDTILLQLAIMEPCIRWDKINQHPTTIYHLVQDIDRFLSLDT